MNKIKGCILPWIHLHGDIRGDYALCCHTDSAKTDNKDFRTGYSTDAPLEVWNNSYMRSVRNSFLSGSYPEECSVCYDKETNNVISHRMNVNNLYSNYAHLQNKTLSDGSIKNHPIYLDFRFGNTCNFRCRMCSPDASTSWFKERHLAFGVKKDKPLVDNWSNNESFWSDFEKIIPNIEVMYFAGGEPFVQEGHYRALELLAKHNTNVSIQYNTNLSYKRFKQYDLKNIWKTFKSVELWPSVDGFKEHAEYGRKELSWELFEDNLDYFRTYIKSVSAVSSVYSVSSTPELVTFLKSKNLSFYVTNLTWPAILSSTILPTTSKKDILSKYKDFLSTVELSQSELDNIKGVLRHMMSRDDSHLLKKFKEYNTALDNSRSESFELTYPEFAEWYKNI